jgi:hypothetical protein
MKKQTIVYSLLLLTAIILVIGIPVFEKIEVYQHSDLNAVSCGWPMKFIVQDQSWRDPPFPWKVPCGFVGEHTTSFNVLVFLIDGAFFYALLIILWGSYVSLNRQK